LNTGRKATIRKSFAHYDYCYQIIPAFPDRVIGFLKCKPPDYGTGKHLHAMSYLELLEFIKDIYKAWRELYNQLLFRCNRLGGQIIKSHLKKHFLSL